MTVTALDMPSTADDHASCGARTKQGGVCKLQAGKGTNHVGHGRCKYHGGSTPTQRQAVAAQVLEEQVRRIFGEVVDTKPVTNPYEVLLEAATEARGWLGVLRAKVAELNSPGYTGLAGEQIKAEVQLYERALDRLANFAGIIARLNLVEKLAAVEAAKAAMLTRAWERAAAAAGLTGPRAIEAGRVFAAELRLIDGEDRHGAP